MVSYILLILIIFNLVVEWSLKKFLLFSHNLIRNRFMDMLIMEFYL